MKLSSLIFFLLSFSSLADTDFTLYLVRHAEKQINSADPLLSTCGSERAVQLAKILSKAQIKNIYSTDYKRTMATATPLAKQEKLTINTYAPQKLKTFALQLINKKQTALIVGHSNTTPQLTALLTNKTVSANAGNNRWLAPLTENDYQMLYQVHFLNGKTKLTRLTQPLSCKVDISKLH